jgi:SAM-dependent methyltransferase
MENRTWNGVVLPPRDLTPCGRLVDTPEKFYLSACEEADRLVSELIRDEHCHVLDIGCGAGRLAIGLRARDVKFERYVGVDVSRSMIDWCAQQLASIDPRLSFIHIDMRNARYNPAGEAGIKALDQLGDEAFDAVNLYSVFSHMAADDVRGYLAFIRRVLRRNGACFLTMFVADDVPPMTENPPGYGGLKWAGPLHCVLYDRQYLLTLLREAGLEIVKEIPEINIDGQTGFVIRRAEAPAPRRGDRDDRHVLVGFFGLNRSLALTLEAIQTNIFEPLARAGFRQVHCAHVNVPETIESTRSGETGFVPDMTRVHELDLEICWIEPQRDANVSAWLDDAMAADVKGEDDPTGLIRRNALQQLHSQRQLGRIISTLGASRFDLFCLFRPDLLYLDPMPAETIWEMINNRGFDLLTPGWHAWSGLNDRFAFCSRRGVYAYLDRICLLRQFIHENGMFHSESLLKFAAENAALSHDTVDMRARRVRANGTVKEENFAE